MAQRTVAVIPARYASSRFPGKPLALIAGQSMIQRVYAQVAACPAIDDVVVATGIVPRTPRIPGVDRANVVTYLDVLQRKVVLGQRVAIIGAGGIGFDVGEFLLHDPAVALPVSIDHWCR